MAFQQGSIVIASDPFKDEDGDRHSTPTRPFVVMNTAQHPFHGNQYLLMTVSTKSYDEGIELQENFLLRGALENRSYALPWSIVSVEVEDIYREVAGLKPPVVEALASELVNYISPKNTSSDEYPTSPPSKVESRA